MTQHHWQCGYHLDQYPNECNCGATGPRSPLMDLLPPDRPPTKAESEAMVLRWLEKKA